MPYKLSATLAAHTEDVRAVASPTNDLVLSASRDTTAISWTRQNAGGSPFALDSVYRAGSRYVNAVAYLPPGYVVTGGQDTVINVFSVNVTKDEPDYTLLGHSENVCTLHTTAEGTIISGSWDRTAKVWKNFALVYDLKGHEQSVWAVLAANETQFITGSADKTIKLWEQHKCVATFTGHQDAVRGLALVPDIGFASCSNDSEIRVWTMGGDTVYTLSGHTSFVYSLSVLPSGDIVSGGEDRSVRVWRDGECAQIITHPAISVWAVSSMPNGDIVSGCSDGVVRVFSASEERWASQEDIKTYEDHVANQALPAQQIGDVKKSDLPGVEALNQPGKKNGEVKMVKNGASVEAHQWDGGSWQKIGDVVDAVGQGRKQLYNGKEYDYVFDVDIKDGAPPLKLPYNANENPFQAAQRFLHANELPLTYVDEVVDFITKNTAGVNLGSGQEEYRDPFTGASRYRSSGPSQSQGGAEAYVDPYTGASRYTGAPPQQQQQPSSTYQDPFTGASRYSGSPAPAASSSILPERNFISFKQARVSAMKNKVLEIDTQLRNEISTSHLALYPQEITAFEEIFDTLTCLTSTPPIKPSKPLNSSHIEALVAVLERWPLSSRFPVVDLSRLVIGFSPSDVYGVRGKLLEVLFKSADWDESWEAGNMSKPRETNVMLALKALANIFRTGAQIQDDQLTWILARLEKSPYFALGKTQRAAFASVLFNISCLELQTPLTPEARSQYVPLLFEVIRTEKADAESVYRVLVGLGNTIHSLKNRSESVASKTELQPLLSPLSTSFADQRIKNIVPEILRLA